MTQSSFDVHRAIRIIGRALQRSVATDNRMLDLVGLAKRAGALDVRYLAQRVQGYTEWTSRGSLVQLALTQSESRRRFTLAHEIGHLVLDPYISPRRLGALSNSQRSSVTSQVEALIGLDPGQILGPVHDSRLEAFCNQIAAELLLPEDHLRSLINTRWTFATLRQQQDEMKVSMSSLLLRLNEFSEGHCLIHAELTPEGVWLVMWNVGGPTWLRRRHTVTWSSGSGFLQRVMITGTQGNIRTLGEVERRGASLYVLCNRRDLGRAWQALRERDDATLGWQFDQQDARLFDTMPVPTRASQAEG